MHWTFSRLKEFETCPKKFEYHYLLGMGPGEPTPALVRGTAVHEAIEHYLIDGTQTLPPLSLVWQREIEGLRALKAQPEQQWEFDADWHPYTHTTGQPLWLRMKLDANYRIKPKVHAVIDFKTGKHYPSNLEQLEVYSLGAFAQFDEVEEVLASLWYIDLGDPCEVTIKRERAPKLARKWEGRANRLLEAKEFPAHPAIHCRWCPYKAVCPSSIA